MGKLSIYAKYDNKSSVLWRFGDNIGDIWNAGQVTIPQISDYPEFSVIFEGLFEIIYQSKVCLQN
jgi:hypothetical protein